LVVHLMSINSLLSWTSINKDGLSQMADIYWSRPASAVWKAGMGGDESLPRDIPFFFTLQNSSHVVSCMIVCAFHREVTAVVLSPLVFYMDFNSESLLWSVSMGIQLPRSFQGYKEEHRDTDASSKPTASFASPPPADERNTAGNGNYFNRNNVSKQTRNTHHFTFLACGALQLSPLVLLANDGHMCKCWLPDAMRTKESVQSHATLRSARTVVQGASYRSLL
ncbi:hypothetical protein GOODEAATRI_015783, partial [Goodea atripinnis]